MNRLAHNLAIVIKNIEETNRTTEYCGDADDDCFDIRAAMRHLLEFDEIRKKKAQEVNKID